MLGALKWGGRAAGLCGLFIAGLVALDHLLPPPLARADQASVVVTDAEGRVLRAFPLEDGRWRLRADVAATDPAFRRALLLYEDRRFYDHRGVDPRALLRAAWQAISTGRVVSGGSTISMQTARLLEPRPRTLFAKVADMFRALQLERRLEKDEILEVYLTLAPYGGNLEGVRAASWAYFGREPDQLTPDQIALLIALPQSPEARRPDRRPAFAVAARARVLERMVEDGALAADRAADAREEPAPVRRDFPAVAWHAAEEARRRAPGELELRTTLDMPLQQTLERLARARVEAEGPGVQAAVLVVETATGAVRAAVGSAGRDRQGGWIDLTDRARSPGSTLKPFIYGMAFDDGVAAPDTIIADAPRRFATYRPENFDRAFRGDVTIAQALQHSLNVPAVTALDAVGAERFAAALSFSGAAPVLPDVADQDAGLAIALGGLGMTARQLASLYVGLAEEGRTRPLIWLEEERQAAASDPGRTLMTAESAAEVLEILRRAPAPPGRMPATLTRAAPSIGYKTGTSYGFRDAWAAGVAGGHAVVVWIGRPDAAPRPGVTGRQAAAPLLFEIFDHVALIDPAIADAGLRPVASPPAASAGEALARFASGPQPPEILFPPDGVEIWADEPGRRFVLAGRGETALDWYVDGRPVALSASGAPVWTPSGPGFYRVSAVDDAGRTTSVRVRVIGPGAMR